MRIFKYCLIVVFSSLILSCSLIKTAYNNAPELATWWLDDYFNFTSAQNSALKPSLQNLHNWHRQNQLPIYLTLLQDMQQSLASNQITATEACEKIDAIKLSIHTLQIETIPIIIEMAPLLNEKQLAYFQKQLVKRTEKWKDEWLQESKEEQLKVRLEKTQDFAEKMYGDLSDVQLMQLKQSFEQTNINPAISYAEIERRNDDALTILKTLQTKSSTEALTQTLSKDDKTQLIKAGFARIQKSPNQEYQAYADNLTKHSCQTIANLHASTTPKQKLHVKNWLQDYINQITALQIK